MVFSGCSAQGTWHGAAHDVEQQLWPAMGTHLSPSPSQHWAFSPWKQWVWSWDSARLPAWREGLHVSLYSQQNPCVKRIVICISQNMHSLLGRPCVVLSQICFMKRAETTCAALWGNSGSGSSFWGVQPHQAFLQGNGQVQVTLCHLHRDAANRSAACGAAAGYHWGANVFKFYSSCYLN